MRSFRHMTLRHISWVPGRVLWSVAMQRRRSDSYPIWIVSRLGNMSRRRRLYCMRSVSLMWSVLWSSSQVGRSSG